MKTDFGAAAIVDVSLKGWRIVNAILTEYRMEILHNRKCEDTVYVVVEDGEMSPPELVEGEL